MANSRQKKAPTPANNSASKSQFEIPSLAVIPVFALLTAIFFSGQLFGDAFFWEDFIEQAYPKATFLANHIADFSIPFWNSGTFNGMPFFADVQTGVFYPPNWLLAFGSGPLLPVGLLQCLIILHVVFAQYSMYRLSRYMGAQRHAAVLAGVAYGFSGIIVCHMFHEMMVYHAAWFPLVLMLALKAMHRKSIRYMGWAGLSAGIMMLSGHPQMTLFCCTLIGLFALTDALVNKRMQSVSLVAGAIVLGGLIFAIQLLPSQELASLSERSEMTYEEASEGSLSWSGVLTAVVPGALGTSGPEQTAAPYTAGPYYFYWETAFYFGIPVLMIAILAFMSSFKRYIPHLVCIVFAIAFSLGDNFVVYRLFHELPFFEGFRMPARMMIGAALFVPLVAAQFFSSLSQQTFHKIHTLVATGLLAACVFICSQFLPETASQAASSFHSTQLMVAIASVVVTFLLVLYGVRKHNMVISGVLLTALTFIGSVNIYGSFNNGTVNPMEAYKLPASAEASLSGTKQDLFRIKIRERGFQMMKQNQGLVSTVQTFEGYNPLLLKKRIAPTGSFQGNLDALNIKYDIAPNAQGQMSFVERPDYFPRFWMVYDTAMVAETDVFDRMNAGQFDIKKQAVLTERFEKDLQLPGQQSGFPIGHSIEVREYTNNKVILNVETSSDGILSMSEVWYPAWKASTPDTELEVVQINYGFRGIPLTKGSHLITMEYSSSTFSTGAILTVVGAILSLCCILIGDKRKTA